MKRDYKKELLAGVKITKDNIHLYYEFMNQEKAIKYMDILNDIFQDRYSILLNELALNRTDKEINFFSNGKFRIIKNKIIQAYSFYGQIHFNIKDTLKHIDEYIEEIKESVAYKEYVGILA